LFLKGALDRTGLPPPDYFHLFIKIPKPYPEIKAYTQRAAKFLKDNLPKNYSDMIEIDQYLF
jgi:hypothetical protein